MEPQIKKEENFFKEVVKFILIAVVVIIPFRAYVAQPFIVSGTSMNPTFNSGQYLIVDQLTYHFKEPKREDVVIFRYPRNPEIYYIKRIIGLPNETLNVKDGKITVINKENPLSISIEDPHVLSNNKKSDNFTITLKKGEYFVMGDNRAESSDSRTWGALEKKYIVGRPILRLTPLSKIGIFPGK